jgi:hypothetical protein
MNIHLITVHATLMSGGNGVVNPYLILYAIRNACKDTGWNGGEWIGPHEWAFACDEVGKPIVLNYVGSATSTPPDNARIFYAPYDDQYPGLAQRRAFCRLCYWVLTAGVAPMDDMPDGHSDFARMTVLKETVSDLENKSTERTRWRSELLALFLEELESFLNVKKSSATFASTPVPEELAGAIVESGPEASDTPVSEITAQIPFSENTAASLVEKVNDVPVNDPKSALEMASADVPVSMVNAYSYAHETLAVATSPSEELQNSCEEVTKSVVTEKSPDLPDWWKNLSQRSNPFTALRIPRNARGGLPIEALDVLYHLGLDKFPQAIVKFQGIQPAGSDIDTGFIYNPSDGVLTGIPKVSGGDYELIFDVILDDELDVKPLRYLIPITINPDPQSLWKTLEPPETDKFKKQHRDGGYENTEGKITAWASVRGRSHAHEAGHRDDDCRVAKLPGKWSLLVVADGAGSAKNSRLGSLIAVETSAQSLRKQLECGEFLTALDEAAKRLAYAEESEKASSFHGWDVLLRAAFEAQKALFEKAKELNVDERTMATTLLICLSCDLGTKTVIGVFSVGDGIVACLGASADRLRLLSVPDSGEFAGQTKFLTNRDLFLAESKPYSRVKVAVIERPAMLLAMTDGVSDPKFDSDESMRDSDCWRSLVDELALPLRQLLDGPNSSRAEALQQWLDFWAVGHHDDRTIAICMDSEFLESYGAS